MTKKIKNPTKNKIRITRILRSSIWYTKDAVNPTGREFYIISKGSEIYNRLKDHQYATHFVEPDAKGPWINAWLYDPKEGDVIYVRGFTCEIIPNTELKPEESYAE